jgi:hypothetical protein
VDTQGRHYWIFPERNLVFVRFTGIVRPEDTLGFAKQLLADPSYRPGLDELIDARACTYEGRFEDVSGYRESRLKTPSLSAGRRWACVVSSDVMYGISRMFEVLAEKAGVEIGVFRDMAEAVGWLGQQGLSLPGPEQEALPPPAP